MHYPLCHALLYPLSYMAGSFLLYEGLTGLAMLQHFYVRRFFLRVSLTGRVAQLVEQLVA